jgi:hypothetical protein
MKIFWSWQSDTPGKVGRHFVRDALRLAIEALKQAPDVEEPTAAETRETIHLDYDRQGVTGSPDLHRRPEPESANNNSAKTKMATAPPATSPSCGQQPLHRPGGSRRSVCVTARWNRRSSRARV